MQRSGGRWLTWASIHEALLATTAGRISRDLNEMSQSGVTGCLREVMAGGDGGELRRLEIPEGSFSPPKVTRTLSYVWNV